MRKTAIVALTKNGAELSYRISKELNADIYVKSAFKRPLPGVFEIAEEFSSLVGRLFTEYSALVFIMASGIVVRTIAPYLSDKRHDPAVVVADELGRHAISLLSGHVGGANQLAVRVAEATGGIPVITTSTDVNGLIAFDIFAKENDCAIEKFEILKYISSELVNEGNLALYSDFRLEGKLPENIEMREDREFSSGNPGVLISNKLYGIPEGKRILVLRPRNLIVGIGSRKGVSKEEVGKAVTDFLERNGKSLLSVKSLATIDVKMNEKGIIDFCGEHDIPLCIVPKEAVQEVAGGFSSSDFVMEKIGVPGVSEPCAVICGHNARLICKKTVYKGITLALAEEEKVLRI